MEFLSHDNFKQWFDLTCNKQKLSLIKRTKKLNKVYFICASSKRSRKSTKKQKRADKSYGSLKVQNHCPIFMNVTYGQTVVVQGCLGPHSHKTNLSSIIIPQYIKKFIEFRIKLKIPDRIILEQLHSEYPNYLTNSQLIRNLKNKIIPNYVYSANDRISVNLLIKENPENFYFTDIDKPIIIFSPGPKISLKNFKYFSIDSTHKTTFYGFYLTTFLAIDEKNRGIPILHLITECENEEIIKLLYSVLNEQFDMPENFILITDDFAPYSTQCAIFFSNFQHILCRWHVRKNLRQNLQKKSSGNIQKALGLIEIITRTKDRKIYQQCLKDLERSTTDEFYDYFLKYYDARKTKWVPAYNESSVFFNMHIESFHSNLKIRYFGKKEE